MANNFFAWRLKEVVSVMIKDDVVKLEELKNKWKM